MSATVSPFGCRYCGAGVMHLGICPRIEEIEYHQDGTVKRVKFRGNAR